VAHDESPDGAAAAQQQQQHTAQSNRGAAGRAGSRLLRMLTYADVCWRMLTYARTNRGTAGRAGRAAPDTPPAASGLAVDVGQPELHSSRAGRKESQVSRRMLTYADVC
jgi:hypothetical protein